MSEEESKNFERELKFACEELSGLRETLVSREAERISASAFEDNLVLDRNGELEEAGCLLRLRSGNQRGALLTFKGPAVYEDRVRIREEYEIETDDKEAMLTILERIGFEVVTRYQKYREEWQLGAVTVALDHTPIGDFAEFEGDGAERMATRCGFDLENAERRSYLRIYRDYREEHPEAPADMVFPD
ncbi:MAG: class IV adenylate cyclase [Thermoanaerobaculia bacterium]|nr:class IV adenylate cyclase [Thermoanaerobaculia bacterium]